MKTISEFDKNFKLESKINKNDIEFYNVLNAPFKVCGLIYEDGKFLRMKKSVAENVSEGVNHLNTNTAGGRARFKTDSPYIAIHAKMSNVGKMPHFALSGSCGFDLYDGKTYIGTFMPPFDLKDGYESVIELPSKKLREITIHFPLYSGVESLYIGISEESQLLPPSDYIRDKPVVFYGSSITQGGCASRPGSSYDNIVGRELMLDHINLGFSGNAKGEDTIAEYISQLDMCAFVYDYDHNAPSTEHLEKTHKKMFDTIRKNHPSIPIIMMSRPKYTLTRDEKIRREIVKKTYISAIQGGDKNVYFISGTELMRLCKNEGTVDNCHPTDLGFFSMSRAVIKTLKKALDI